MSVAVHAVEPAVPALRWDVGARCYRDSQAAYSRQDQARLRCVGFKVKCRRLDDRHEGARSGALSLATTLRIMLPLNERTHEHSRKSKSASSEITDDTLAALCVWIIEFTEKEGKSGNARALL